MFDVTLNDPLALKKLVDVIAIGCGKITAPYLTKKNAEAKAYETLTIANAQAKALEQTAGFLKKISYNDTAVEMETLDMGPREVGIEQRALYRKVYQEIMGQLNIEAISQIAFQELEKEQAVSSNPVDNNWIRRFFDIASEISEDELRLLWGKILAGEVKQPGSFSLRSLEVLRNLTKYEAEIFLKFSEGAFWYEQGAFFFNSSESRFLELFFSISFSDRLLMQEVGLLDGNSNLLLNFSPTTVEEESGIFVSGDRGLQIRRLPNCPPTKLPVFKFTMAGYQLLKLVSKPRSIIHLNKMGLFLKSENIKVSIGDVVIKDNGIFSFKKTEDL